MKSNNGKYYVLEAWPGEGYSMGVVWSGSSLLAALWQVWTTMRDGKDGVTLRSRRTA